MEWSPEKQGKDMVTLAHWRHCSGGSLETRMMGGVRGVGGMLRLVFRENSPRERQSGLKFQWGGRKERRLHTILLSQTQQTLPSPPHSLLSTLASLSPAAPGQEPTQSSEGLSSNTWEVGMGRGEEAKSGSWQKQPTPASHFEGLCLTTAEFHLHFAVHSAQ